MYFIMIFLFKTNLYKRQETQLYTAVLLHAGNVCDVVGLATITGTKYLER